jgi:hypothetical protein
MKKREMMEALLRYQSEEIARLRSEVTELQYENLLLEKAKTTASDMFDRAASSTPSAEEMRLQGEIDTLESLLSAHGIPLPK